MNDVKDNLAVRIAADPQLMKLFTKLKDPYYDIPEKYEKTIKELGTIKNVNKGLLISKVTTPDDYQTNLKLISALQHCLDNLHEINTDLYIIQSRYKEIHSLGMNILMLNYFTELDTLKDGVRKTLLTIALRPIQEGLDKLETLINIGERTHKHLTATTWNVKMSTQVLQDYLSIFKFGSSARVPIDQEL